MSQPSSRAASEHDETLAEPQVLPAVPRGNHLTPELLRTRNELSGARSKLAAARSEAQRLQVWLQCCCVLCLVCLALLQRSQRSDSSRACPGKSQLPLVICSRQLEVVREHAARQRAERSLAQALQAAVPSSATAELNIQASNCSSVRPHVQNSSCTQFFNTCPASHCNEALPFVTCANFHVYACMRRRPQSCEDAWRQQRKPQSRGGARCSLKRPKHKTRWVS